MVVSEEHVLEGFCEDAAAYATAELACNLLGISCWAVNVNDARWGTIVLESNAVWVRDVGYGEGWEFVCEDIADCMPVLVHRLFGLMILPMLWEVSCRMVA